MPLPSNPVPRLGLDAFGRAFQGQAADDHRRRTGRIFETLER